MPGNTCPLLHPHFSLAQGSSGVPYCYSYHSLTSHCSSMPFFLSCLHPFLFLPTLLLPCSTKSKPISPQFLKTVHLVNWLKNVYTCPFPLSVPLDVWISSCLPPPIACCRSNERPDQHWPSGGLTCFHFLLKLCPIAVGISPCSPRRGGDTMWKSLKMPHPTPANPREMRSVNQGVATDPWGRPAPNRTPPKFPPPESDAK